MAAYWLFVALCENKRVTIRIDAFTIVVNANHEAAFIGVARSNPLDGDKLCGTLDNGEFDGDHAIGWTFHFINLANFK